MCCSFFEFHFTYFSVSSVTHVTPCGPLTSLASSGVESPVPPQREADGPGGGVLEDGDGLVLPRLAEVGVVHPQDLVAARQGAGYHRSHLK